MPGLVRFGVSLEKELLGAFDKHLKEKKYATRSKALEDLIRADLIARTWSEGTGEVAGTVTLVYNHHKRSLVNKLLDIQHDYQALIVSTQHVHLNHENCLEVIVLKGVPGKVRELSGRLTSEKGVKHVSLTMTTAGE
ncbi:MAG: nickel-responsive transcriptional regulator NikR [Endomicrobiales bacterium]